jgi:hypothetical protein
MPRINSSELVRGADTVVNQVQAAAVAEGACAAVWRWSAYCRFGRGPPRAKAISLAPTAQGSALISRYVTKPTGAGRNKMQVFAADAFVVRRSALCTFRDGLFRCRTGYVLISSAGYA